MDRIQQDLHAEEERRKTGPTDHQQNGGGEGKAKDDDNDNDGQPKKRPRTSRSIRRAKFTTREERPGRSGAGLGSRPAGGMADADQVRSNFFFLPKMTFMDPQDIMHIASSRRVLLVHLCYGIYLSPGPAIFVRVGAHPAEVSEREDNFSSDSEIRLPESMDIILHSELEPGSTGIVHIGEMEVEPFGPTVTVAVKLAFSKEHKLALEREHRLYSHMNPEGVRGIPQSLGLFVGSDCGGAEAPYALVMTYAGVTLFGQKGEASCSAK